MAVINDGVVEAWWQEPGINNDGTDDDPYVESTPENMMLYLQTQKTHKESEINTMIGVDV
jgi:hypothetical protein